MKSMVLAFTVVLFATLLSVASAGTDAGMQVVASYEGYDKRQFPNKPLLLCATLRSMSNIDLKRTNNSLQSFVNQQASRGTRIPLGTPTIIILYLAQGGGTYCKYVADTYTGPMFNTHSDVWIRNEKFYQYAYYAKKVADQSPQAIYAAGKAMTKVMEGMTDPKLAIHKGLLLVEITANNEVYVGPIDRNVYSTTFPTPP